MNDKLEFTVLGMLNELIIVFTGTNFDSGKGQWFRVIYKLWLPVWVCQIRFVNASYRRTGVSSVGTHLFRKPERKPKVPFLVLKPCSIVTFITGSLVYLRVR